MVLMFVIQSSLQIKQYLGIATDEFMWRDMPDSVRAPIRFHKSVLPLEAQCTQPYFSICFNHREPQQIFEFPCTFLKPT